MDDRENFQDSPEYKFSEAEIGADAHGKNFQHSDFSSGDLSEGRGKLSQLIKLGSSFLKNTNWQRFTVPGGIILSIFVIYFVFSFFATKKNSTSEQDKIFIQDQAASLAQQQMVVPVSTPPTAVVNYGNNITSEELNNLRGNLQQKIDQLERRLVDSNSRLTNAVSSIADCKQEIAEVAQNINVLVEGIKQMLGDIDDLKRKDQLKQKVVIPKPKMGYVVLAIMPGRAWLKSEHGKTITLKVGDRLAGYGEVRAISVRQGMVMMSDGSVIQYGVN